MTNRETKASLALMLLMTAVIVAAGYLRGCDAINGGRETTATPDSTLITLSKGAKALGGDTAAARQTAGFDTIALLEAEQRYNRADSLDKLARKARRDSLRHARKAAQAGSSGTGKDTRRAARPSPAPTPSPLERPVRE